MEKIVLVSHEPGDQAHMVPLIEALFPECTVEIISETGGKVNPVSAPTKKDIHSCQA